MDLLSFIREKTRHCGGVSLEDLNVWCKQNDMCPYLQKLRCLKESGLIFLEGKIVKASRKAWPDK